jgi:hypothetical protein
MRELVSKLFLFLKQIELILYCSNILYWVLLIIFVLSGNKKYVSLMHLQCQSETHQDIKDHDKTWCLLIYKLWFFFIFVGCFLLRYIIALSKYTCSRNRNSHHFTSVFRNMFRPLQAIFRCNTTSIIHLKGHQYCNGSVVLVLFTHVARTT